MNSNEIRWMLSRDTKTKQCFIDVFAIDEFKDFVRKNTLLRGLYIVNSDASNSPGEHWFLIFHKEGYLSFMDSFAKSEKFYNIEEELNSVRRKIDKVPFQIQHPLSDVCGEYVIYFAYNLCRNISLKDALKYFSENCKDNDNKVLNFVNKYFPGHSRILP